MVSAAAMPCGEEGEGMSDSDKEVETTETFMNHEVNAEINADEEECMMLDEVESPEPVKLQRQEEEGEREDWDKELDDNPYDEYPTYQHHTYQVCFDKEPHQFCPGHQHASPIKWRKPKLFVAHGQFEDAEQMILFSRATTFKAAVTTVSETKYHKRENEKKGTIVRWRCQSKRNIRNWFCISVESD